MTSMWRRFLALLMVFGLLTAACGSDSDSSSSSSSESASSSSSSAEEEEPAEEFKIGLVTDTGKVDDKAFNQSAWEGATSGAAQIEGATTDYIETEESKDYANNIQLFLDDGASVIITVGFGLGEATIEAAKANPDVLFIGDAQFQLEAIPNLAGPLT